MQTAGEGRWVVAMADPAAARALTHALPADLPCAVAHDGLTAFDIVCTAMPEVLIADLVLPQWDGLELVRRISAAPLFTLPFALLIVAPGMERFAQLAREAGACTVLPKPVSGADLLDWAAGLTPLQRLPRERVTEQHILRKMWTLGFSARMQGTKYLAMAIELASRDVRLNKLLTKTLYPLVAQRYQVGEQQVEHAMRRAIESAWSGGCLEAQYKLFGNTIDAKRAKPTAGEMIACLAELLRTGMETDE